MKSNSHWLVVAGLTLLVGAVNADDHMPWVADFNTACGMAAEQRRLVLLHFYNDNCGPCVRVEQNVFSKPEVADAVAQNYLAVKVHAGKNPQLATKYHVNQWPTDVFVTASGLEVFRTVSPQKPADYIAVLNQVATQAGVGSGRSNNNPLYTIAQVGSKTQAAVGAAAAGLTGAFAAAGQRVQQTTADAQRAAAETQQKWNATTLQAQNTMNQTRAATTNAVQQATATVAQSEQQATTVAQQSADRAAAAAQQVQQQTTAVAQQSTNTANQWESQVTSTVQRYEQQASDTYRQTRDQASQAGQQIAQQAETTKQQWQTTATQTAQEVGAAAQNLQQQASSLLERRSAFVPVETSPAAAAAPAAPAANAPATAPPAPSATSATVIAATPPSSPTVPRVESPAATANAAPALTSNPWVTKPAESPQSQVATPPASSATASLTQAYSNATAAATGGAAAVQASAQLPAQQPQPVSKNAAAANHQMVPVSQAPPVGLDGFCPVTLVETMIKSPGDRNAWKKGDRRFGAIHKGRTYLFTSTEQQQKFLQNPDAYAPVLSGCDPVLLAERGQMVDGKRAFGLVTADKHIYLFAEEASRNRFEKSPANYAAALQQVVAQTQSASIYR